ncbi:MAG: alkaline phosphatase family protein [Dissulfurispiraceae bacterium]
MADKLSSHGMKKAIVLGLDGVPYSLLQRFILDGIMPNLARLGEEGTLCSMTSSLPEVSSTAWSTFMTGVNPGRHSIFGFTEINKDTYSWKFPNFNDLRSKTIWELAGENGKRSIVLNVPSTYPARPLYGMMVSGFVALDLKKASYPGELFQYLSNIDYVIDVDAGKATKSLDDFTDDLLHTFRKRKKAILHLFDSEHWDLFIAVVTETDRLHHYLWDAMEDDSHSKHDFFLNFYAELDRFIGSIHERMRQNMSLIILSDHGFTSIKKEVHLNVFLQEKGYLRFIKSKPESFQDMASGSLAFALSPARIYIHLKDKYAHGSVQQDRYEEIVNAVARDLVSLELEGNKVIRSIFYKKDLYRGAYFDDAPDLVILPHEGYDLKSSLSADKISGRSPLTGGHTWENAAFFINEKIQCKSPNIIDVGGTVLKSLGILPNGLEGSYLI